MTDTDTDTLLLEAVEATVGEYYRETTTLLKGELADRGLQVIACKPEPASALHKPDSESPALHNTSDFDQSRVEAIGDVLAERNSHAASILHEAMRIIAADPATARLAEQDAAIREMENLVNDMAAHIEKKHNHGPAKRAGIRLELLGRYRALIAKHGARS